MLHYFVSSGSMLGLHFARKFSSGTDDILSGGMKVSYSSLPPQFRGGGSLQITNHAYSGVVRSF